jgi:L-alanine-DL-glutamate epimerase-like enolase superfamily enzyme
MAAAELPPALANLPLEVDGVSLGYAIEGERRIGLVRLTGGGHEGVGEDVGAGGPFGPYEPPPVLALDGTFTLAEFRATLEEMRWFPTPPDWAPMARYRRWAFESAALDLALRQAGTSLPEALGREPRPLRFVVSFPLGDPPRVEEVLDRLALRPGMRFKIDIQETWTPEIIATIAETASVDILDFKGHYGLEVKDEDRLLAVYQAALEAFPDALIEDPHDLHPIAELVAPHAGRVSYDAPIHAVPDLATTRHRSAAVNVKPSRVGDLAEILALYAHAEREGLPLYGGGMGERPLARGQAQLLAALFHPDGPNDLAPSGYNLGLPTPDLPDSPLVPREPQLGFRW